jgi:hypothetical protein
VKLGRKIGHQQASKKAKQDKLARKAKLETYKKEEIKWEKKGKATMENWLNGRPRIIQAGTKLNCGIVFSGVLTPARVVSLVLVFQ